VIQGTDMNRELKLAIEQVGREKGIPTEVLFEALESALLSASKRTMGVGDNTRLTLHRETGAIRVFAEKRVVEKVTDPKLEIGLEEARRLKPAAQLEDVVEVDLEMRDLGRIAAQTAKQVILQRVREAERQGIFSEYKDREGTLVRGLVHRIEKRTVIMDLGRTEAVLPEREQIPGERYAAGDRVRAFLLEVKNTPKGPQVVLSRAHPGFLVRLFETEIPEIAEGIVQVRAAAREPGERAKLAVASTKRDIDPIGACVGLRGTRIQAIVKELRGEKIDIIEWSDDVATLVARALSPAKVNSVTLSGEGDDRSALVVVPDSQLSLAIGKKGQNARLAAKLTGLRVDVKSESELAEERRRLEDERLRGLAALEEIPEIGAELAPALVKHGLGSPARIRTAGIEPLRAALGPLGDRAEAVLSGVGTWLAAKAAEAEAEVRARAEAEARAAAEADAMAKSRDTDARPERAEVSAAEPDQVAAETPRGEAESR
jgi:transcription termination/antitermination protein NusA